MKAKVYFYILTDARGGKSWDCVNDLSDSICFGGYDKDGKYWQYDSYEGYHSYDWAAKHGFKVECVDKEVEI